MTLFAVAVATAVVVLRATPNRARRDGRGSAAAPVPQPAASPAAGAPFRVLAGCAAAGAVLLYAWGVLCVAFAVMEAEDGGTGSAPLRPCRTDEHPELSGRIVDYSVSWLPLGFRCETADGDGYTSDDVPGYVNPGTAVLALTAAGSAVAAGYATEPRARAAARNGGDDRPFEHPRGPV
ncbi:hypothetical protein ACFWR9_24495 [Streptomyces sp. NPDC058534]|uniref:hypothetical protein n=1 Tax=Streptomyces sp. NPDC058534 TaxID=3346541 RepID=UPI00364A751D